jgi:TRAP-type mannitol/chloroaromatic compound transport system permease large subunit
MGFLTSSFGYNLFYMKAAGTRDISVIDIYRSIIYLVISPVIGLVICMISPQIITWLSYR